jgi:hypothetical protein
MNGIGGRTIAEAQENMSFAEWIVWLKFRGKRGSLHTGMRVEVAFAEFQALWLNTKTQKDAPKLYAQDFAPHMDPRIITAEELARSMGAI